jgi:hypothetical protein
MSSYSTRLPGAYRFTEPIIFTHPIPCLMATTPLWPAPGSEDTELGVLMELEVGHGETEVYAGVQA